MNFNTLQSLINTCETAASNRESLDKQQRLHDPSPSIEDFRQIAHILQHLPLDALTKLPPYQSCTTPPFP